MSSFLRIGMSDVYFSIRAVALLKTESIFCILIRTYIYYYWPFQSCIQVKFFFIVKSLIEIEFVLQQIDLVEERIKETNKSKQKNAG